MSNPHDGGFAPYEPPVGGPYGEPAAPNPYGTADRSSAPTDGLSIAALVCSLTCCAAPVGIGLGIAGLVRTSGGRRSGRWAAMTGLVFGSVVLVCGLAFVVFAGIMGSKTVWEYEASVGQCIGWDLFNDPEKATCSGPHYAEISSAGQLTSDQAVSFDDGTVAEFCKSLEPDAQYLDAVESGDFEFDISIDAFDEDEPDSGDWFFCYVERVDEGQFRGELPETSSSTGA